jgi:NAD(P)-dependent dehydrogenase (short-subunit alcohol dehydrogenase family)
VAHDAASALAGDVANAYRPRIMAKTERAVVITGVSSGIGLAMAKKLLGHGYRVFGSVRSSAKAQELQASLGPRFTPLVFDICTQHEIDAARAELAQRLNGEPLAALINNAGSAEIGPLLHVAPESLQRQLDTLVVGQLRVIQAFFEYLTPPSTPPGRIFNISSVSGVGANTFFGCYAAGKHALEGLSKTLREELRDRGVPVIVIAPGNIATDIWPKQTDDLIAGYRGTRYYPALQGALREMRTHTVRDAMSVDEFAEAFYTIFRSPTPADRYTVIKMRRRRWLSRFRVRVIEG